MSTSKQNELWPSIGEQFLNGNDRWVWETESPTESGTLPLSREASQAAHPSVQCTQRVKYSSDWPITTLTPESTEFVPTLRGWGYLSPTIVHTSSANSKAIVGT